jgi:hypothetical protein
MLDKLNRSSSQKRKLSKLLAGAMAFQLTVVAVLTPASAAFAGPRSPQSH